MTKKDVLLTVAEELLLLKGTATLSKIQQHQLQIYIPEHMEGTFENIPYVPQASSFALA